MTTSVLPASSAARSAPPASGAYKVDISRGTRIVRVSSEWFSRPDDERYLSLSALHAAVRARAERATARTVESKALRVEASRDDAERLSLIVPGQDAPVAPTHSSYGQLCSRRGSPFYTPMKWARLDAYLRAGSDRGGQRAAFMYTLIVTAKLDDIDPQAWLADVLARIADLPQTRRHELLPWNWRRQDLALKAA